MAFYADTNGSASHSGSLPVLRGSQLRSGCRCDRRFHSACQICSLFDSTGEEDSMIRPTREELGVLAPVERLGFHLADLIARHAPGFSTAWNSTILVATTWLIVRRRLVVSGLEHIRALDPDRGVIMVANHRSFFDFFTIECALFSRTGMSRRLLFPVRANFFYDHPLGLAINFAMSGMTMFPPVLRTPHKRSFNRYGTRRCAAEIEQNKVVLGLHPEGTRNQHPDPFHLRPGKLGIGEILLEAPSAQVLPVFLTGLTNDFLEELRRNWRCPEQHPIHIAFGPTIDLSDLQAARAERRAQRSAVDRAMQGIRAVAEACRAKLQAPTGPLGSSADAPEEQRTQRRA